MKKLFRKILAGDTAISEYSNITLTGDILEKVYLETAGFTMDISGCHCLLCIDPAIFGIWIKRQDFIAPLKETGTYHMYVGLPVQGDSRQFQKDAEAVIGLDFFDSIEEAGGVLLLLRVKNSHLHQLNLIKRYLLYWRYYRRNGLTWQRFKNFTAAYSYPRRIRLISFRQGDYYNIFPMDLLGDLEGCSRYVFGLRHTNIALPRIIQTGRLAVCEIPSEYKHIIYQLGQHHSSAPPLIADLPFKVFHSHTYGFYIPSWAESYKEIRIVRTENIGSHMLLWGELAYKHVLTPPAHPLFLIHFLHYLIIRNKKIPYTLLQ